MTQVTREPSEGVTENTGAQGGKDLDPAQEQQQQEKEAGRLRRCTTNEQYRVCREEGANLRQRIEQHSSTNSAR